MIIRIGIEVAILEYYLFPDIGVQKLIAHAPEFLLIANWPNRKKKALRWPPLMWVGAIILSRFLESG